MISGEHFEGLDLLTKLLSNETNKQKYKKPLIEVIGQQIDPQNDTLLEAIDEDFDWHLDQRVRLESEELSLIGEKYGFGEQYSGIIARIEEEFSDLIDIKDPEHKNYSQRRKERLETEAKDFSDDHYLSDMFDQKELISQIISYKVFDSDHQKDVIFSDEQIFRLKNLPKKEYIFDKTTKKSLLLSMVDILFSYAYDMRVNECEPNVESGWTLTKLSATLSWFDSYSSLKEVVITCLRRSLGYPLYRNWNLSLKVLEDVIKILRFGQNYVLKCFLEINRIFNVCGDGRYLLNDIYITDYCVWLQYLTPNTFQSLSTALQDIRVTKSDLNLDLDILEMAAQLAIDENIKSNDETNTETFDSNVENLKQIEENLCKRMCESISLHTNDTNPSTSQTNDINVKNENIDSDDDLLIDDSHY